jgi:hypothetical protein
MRYVVKFNNGAWKVFDTRRYDDAAICGLESVAKDLADNMNLDELNKARARR